MNFHQPPKWLCFLFLSLFCLDFSITLLGIHFAFINMHYFFHSSRPEICLKIEVFDFEIILGFLKKAICFVTYRIQEFGAHAHSVYGEITHVSSFICTSLCVKLSFVHIFQAIYQWFCFGSKSETNWSIGCRKCAQLSKHLTFAETSCFLSAGRFS